MRVLHVLVPGNAANPESPRVPSPALGDPVDDVWGQLARAEDRFLHVRPDAFLNERGVR